MKVNVLVLFGPTAIGKTDFLNRLCERGEIPLEIISADSMQVYKGMDIGTAKPSLKERERIPHHLIDIRDPDEQFNAGDFVRLAEEACISAAGRSSLPVVSGGTGFYLKNLIHGLGDAPPSDLEIRASLKKDFAEKGPAVLMEELARLDPISAERIHINDEYRLLRALEVCRLTGQPLSAFASPWTGGRLEPPLSKERPFSFTVLSLNRNREELYDRINARTDKMFKAGLPDEVQGLFNRGYTPDAPGLRAIGYREFFVLKDSKWALSEDIEGVKALVAKNSRRYAKRQITFFKSIPGVKRIDCEDGEKALREIIEVLRQFKPAYSHASS